MTVCVLLCLCSSFATASTSPRVDIDINTGWKFSRSNPADAARKVCNDTAWLAVELPHTWNALDGQDGGNDYYRGIGWYRKNLVLDEASRGRSIFLRFDAASTAAQVYVNEHLAGSHKGGFSAFCLEVTRYVTFGSPNLIAVQVSNAYDSSIAPLRGDFTIFGGLYRGVHLLVLDELSISPLDDGSSGVYVKQVNVSPDSAILEITTVLRNASPYRKSISLRSSVLDREGNVAASVESLSQVEKHSQSDRVQIVTLRNPRLWDGRNDPYLYRVVVELIEGDTVRDRVSEPLGLRCFHIDALKGFFLNGRWYPLHGVSRHQDRQDKGWAIGIAEHREDYRLIEELGCTAVRLAHYQQAREFYDLCDKGGMVVWAELALVDFVSSGEAFAECTRQQLRELIKQNYNHPSIIFWSLFNELIPDRNREMYAQLVTGLNDLAHVLDPARLTTMASRSSYDGGEYINTVTAVSGYNVYKGWYEGMPQDIAPYVDSLHERFPEQKFSIAEYGAGAGISQHELPPQKPKTTSCWHPEEWQSYYHEVHWMELAKRPWIWGTFVWNMFDFASDSRLEGELPGRNDKGLVTYDRTVRKDAFFWYKANWNPSPVVHITSQRFIPRPAGHTSVTVYSNCDSVVLVVNGGVIGYTTVAGRKFFWDDVCLIAGRNTIEAVGFRDGQSYREKCEWIGK